MDILTSNSALLLEKSVGFLWTKQAAILDNIANAETPNYKAKVVTFEESIRSKLEQAAAHPGEAEKSVRDILEDPEVTVFEAQEQKRMDDNGVDTTEQMVELIGRTATRNAKEHARRLMEKVYLMQELRARDDMTILVGSIWEK